MFNDKDENWSPFSTQRKPVDTQVEKDPSAAVEIQPVTVMARHNRAIITPVEELVKKEEAKAPAEEDPKAVDSSVTNSAEDSDFDSSTTGSPETQTQILIHPSTLPLDEDNPVPAEKDLNPPLVQAFMPMNLG